MKGSLNIQATSVIPCSRGPAASLESCASFFLSHSLTAVPLKPQYRQSSSHYACCPGPSSATPSQFLISPKPAALASSNRFANPPELAVLTNPLARDYLSATQKQSNNLVNMTAIIPGDAWMCCQCSGANVIELEEYCPDCNHQKCSTCLGPGQSYDATLALGFSTDALSLATSSSAVPSTSPSFSRISACSSQEHDTNHTGGFNNAGIITDMDDDVWVCCQCKSANLAANSPERCPVCAHFQCSICK